MSFGRRSLRAGNLRRNLICRAAGLWVVACGVCALAQEVPPEAQGDFYTEPLSMQLPQDGFDSLTTVVKEQPVGDMSAIKIPGGGWQSRLGDPAQNAGIACLKTLGIWPSTESKVGKRCIAAGYEAVRPYPPEELALVERGKMQWLQLQLWTEKPWDLTGRKTLVFWLRVSNPKPLWKEEAKVDLMGMAGDKRIYLVGGTPQLLSAKVEDGQWHEIRIPLAELKLSGTTLKDFPWNKVMLFDLVWYIATPEIFTEIFWIDGFHFE